MKGDPRVLACLQESVTLELTLKLQYMLYHWDLSRLGIETKDGFDMLAGQCGHWAHEMTRRILFLEGTPILDPTQATMAANVSAMLSLSVAAEQQAIDAYAGYVVTAWDAKDMSNFHWFQHMSKWHREGDDKHKGHMAWLAKQTWQVGTIGQSAYLAEMLVKP
jgi:bacterioferritin (cytochrome b1)